MGGGGGGKRCICLCEVSTKIAYGGSNLQLSMYKLHKRVQQLFLSYGNEIHTCATVKEPIEDKTFKVSYIISHNIYNNRGTALSTSQIYTYLLKVTEVLFLLEGRFANMACIYTFMHPF